MLVNSKLAFRATEYSVLGTCICCSHPWVPTSEGNLGIIMAVKYLAPSGFVEICTHPIVRPSDHPVN